MIGGELLTRQEKPHKKQTMKGVLDKTDLAESYKVRKKKSRHVSTGDQPTITTPVRAVEFKEALLEELVPTFLNDRDEQNERQRKRSSGRNSNFKEVIRRISTVESFHNLPSHNSETTLPKPWSPPTPAHRKPVQSLSNNLIAPTGYEPESSLVRRKKEQSPEVLPDSNYDTSGGLNRRRRPSAQKDDKKTTGEAVTAAPERRRRSGAGLLAPELRENKLRTKRISLPLLTTTKKSSPPRSPPSANNQRITFFIPEDEAVGEIPKTASPTVQRRSRMSPAISRRTPSPLSPPDRIKIRSTKKPTQNEQQHSNATRYWDWLLLNSSYSWQSFNTDKVMCY